MDVAQLFCGIRTRPAADVVLLSWNRVGDTLDCIASLQAQQGVELRIWIVDQGSTPATLVRLRALASEKITLMELGRNVGVPAGRNIGMRLGSAAWVIVIDNDAVFAEPAGILRAIRRFEAEPQLAALGFRIKNYFTGADDIPNWGYPRALFPRKAEEFLTTRFVGCGHALRRSAVAKTNLYEDRLFFNWEELDLSYQLIRLGYHIVYDPSIVVLHKLSPEQRVDWRGSRYYYFCRNIIYLNHKYFGSYRQTAAFSLAYLVKGVLNRVPRQTLRGIRDGLAMIRRARREKNLLPLGGPARVYVFENERRHRGNLWQRIRVELLRKLP